MRLHGLTNETEEEEFVGFNFFFSFIPLSLVEN